jgi:hypothetical protein
MPAPNECWFDHERLEVYQEAIALIAWLSAILEVTVRIGDVKDQLDRALLIVLSLLILFKILLFISLFLSCESRS